MARILVVDDDPIVIELVSARLGELGHEVPIASNGLEALKAFDGPKIDLVILDLMMPEMNGVEFVARLRGKRMRHPPILVLTSVSSPRIHEQMIMLGVDDYITKPFDTRDLERKVTNLLSRSGTTRINVRTICVLDDDEVFLALAAEQLSNRGFLVLTARDSEELTRLTNVEKPHLFLMDLGLPDVDGHHTCFAVKRDVRFRNIPVIVVTVSTDSVEHEKARRLGADDVVVKPVDWEDLVVKIRHAVAQAAMARLG